VVSLPAGLQVIGSLDVLIVALLMLFASLIVVIGVYWTLE
jgi:hypothetical protein